MKVAVVLPNAIRVAPYVGHYVVPIRAAGTSLSSSVGRRVMHLMVKERLPIQDANTTMSRETRLISSWDIGDTHGSSSVLSPRTISAEWSTRSTHVLRRVYGGSSCSRRAGAMGRPSALPATDESAIQPCASNLDRGRGDDFAQDLMDRGLVACTATDAHDAVSRPPVILHHPFADLKLS